jgi:hypothetical protein
MPLRCIDTQNCLDDAPGFEKQDADLGVNF